MNRRLAPICFAFLFAFAAFAQTPATPNLSGAWVLNVAKSKPHKGTTLGPQAWIFPTAGSSQS